MKKILIALFVVLLIAAWIFYVRISSAVSQPLDFSHSQHVKAGITCERCHDPNLLDELPGTDGCRNCHQQNFPAKASWVKVYRVAPDIIFTHDKHRSTNCATCHEAMVDARRFVYRSGYTMKFCMDCHAKKGAANQCGTCHKNR